MNDFSRRSYATELTWAALGSQLRFYRLLLITLLVLLAVHVTTGGWAQFRPSKPLKTASLGALQTVGADVRTKRPDALSDGPSGTEAKPRPVVPPKPRWPSLTLVVQTSIRQAGHRLGQGMATSHERFEGFSAKIGGCLAERAAELLRHSEPPKIAVPPVQPANRAAASEKLPHEPPPPKRPATSVVAVPPAKTVETPAKPLETDDLVLHNPQSNGGAVSYLLGDVQRTLAPGDSQKLTFGRPWRIEFHRGESFGYAAHSLSSGNYEFRVTRHGWQLVRATSPERDE